MRSFVHILILATLGLASVAPARAQDRPAAAAGEDNAEARMQFDVARRFYDSGHFAEAAEHFEAAYRISHLVALQYNLYLAYRDAGDDARAAAALQRYVASLEPGDTRTQLTARLRVLERRLERQAANTPSDGESTPASELSERQASPDAASTTTASRDATAAQSGQPDSDANAAEHSNGSGLAPWILVGTGGALIAGAVVTGLMTRSQESDLHQLCPTRTTCSAGFEDARSKGQRLALTTDLLWVSGAAAGAVGLLWAMLSGDGDEDPAAVAGLVCDDRGCTASLSGEF